ncbi:MAG: nuclear transport factor 2 family protein [Pseudomonadota bacterium]
MSAEHWIGDAYWRVDGRYAYELERDGTDWKISSMTFTVTGEEGSRDVFGPALDAARSHPAPYIQRQQTIKAVRDFLEGLEEKDMEKVNSVWAEDAVQDMPYVPTGSPSRIVGKEALIAQYANWPNLSGDANFTDHLVFYPMADPQMTFVEFRGEVDIIPTGAEYRQTYGGLFHVVDGKIALFREYFDPREFARAFGVEQ